MTRWLTQPLPAHFHARPQVIELGPHRHLAAAVAGDVFLQVFQQDFQAADAGLEFDRLRRVGGFMTGNWGYGFATFCQRAPIVSERL
jgi:hypothetical protein